MSIPTPIYPGITISRNAEGWPVIDAPTIDLAYEGLGYMVATDRTWQLFDLIMRANGLAPSYRGAVAVPDAIHVLSYLYTEADFNTQFNQWSDISKRLAIAYTKGVNARFSQILAGQVPLPDQFVIMQVQPRIFSLYQVMNMIYDDFLSNAEVNLDAQLQSFQAFLGISFTNTPEDTDLIASDFLGVNGVTKSRWTITEGDACGTIGDLNIEPFRLINRTHCKASKDCGQCLKDFIKKRDDLKNYRLTHGYHPGHGSYAAALGPRKVVGNDTLGFGAPQNINPAPSVMYIALLNTPDYKATNATFVNSPLLVNDGCSILNGCYAYNVDVTTALRSQRYYSIEPASNAVPYANYIIEVRGGPNIPYTASRSVTSGFVLGPFILPGSILVARSVNVNNAMLGMDPIIRLLFLQSFQDWQEFPFFPNQTDIVSYNLLFHDSDSNIGAVLASNSVVPPAGVNGKLPEVATIYEPFLYVNPIRPISEFIVTPPSTSFNESPYYVDWNGAWNSLPLDLSAPFYEYSRVWWIYNLLDQKTSFSYYDLRELMIRISDTKLFAGGHGVTVETSEPRLVAQSDAFLLLRDRFAQAIANNPTPLRLSLLSELLVYDGSFIGGDLDNVLTSPNVPDAWFLANTWLAQTVLAFLGPVAPLVVNQGSTPWDVLFFAVPLLIRLLINPCNNPIFYTGYPGFNNPTAQDQLIAAALDNAYNQLLGFLGPRPWGTNLRFQFPFVNEFAGTVGTIPWIQHGALEARADLNTSGVMAHGASLGPGVTDRITLTPFGAVPQPSMVNLLEEFQFFDIPEFGGRLKPGRCFRSRIQQKKCIEKHKCFL